MFSSPQRRARDTQRKREQKVKVGKRESGYRCDAEQSVGQEGFRQHQVTTETKGSRKRERGGRVSQKREWKWERGEASSDLLPDNLGSEPIKWIQNPARAAEPPPRTWMTCFSETTTRTTITTTITTTTTAAPPYPHPRRAASSSARRWAAASTCGLETPSQPR